MTRTTASLLFALALFLPAAHAERVTIPGHVPAEQSLPMPSRGMKMDRVLAEFGEPNSRKGPVGDPPITVWDYGNFKVYFEYDTVLHTVDLTTLVMPGSATE